jgi:hypothetical protein
MLENEAGEVLRIVEKYLHGIHTGSIPELQAAFHEQSRLHALNEKGEMSVEDRDAWLARVAARQSPESKGEKRDDAIEWVAVEGPSMASVRLQVRIGAHRYQDLLTLLRTARGWRIATKTFRDATPA